MKDFNKRFIIISILSRIWTIKKCKERTSQVITHLQIELKVALFSLSALFK